ncbi:eukaryotic translation initiation factor 1 [Mus pahari]|uniref:eukaryotic translation initiation factor 1 n=1 Tax=Mus pahari TaxID=10093 RepID=UPI001114EB47|nr:eukaryotic translation initiation factor 1 [Mus pahari]
MSAIQNLHSFDPFADASKGDDLLPAGTEDYIHIRIQQRNGRKTLTTVQGIADDYDKKKLVKAFKKVGLLWREHIGTNAKLVPLVIWLAVEASTQYEPLPSAM